MRQCSTCRCGFPESRKRRLYRNGDGDLLHSGGGAKHSADNSVKGNSKMELEFNKKYYYYTFILMKTGLFCCLVIQNIVSIRCTIVQLWVAFSHLFQRKLQLWLKAVKLLFFLHEGRCFESINCAKTFQRFFKDIMCLLAH